MTIGFGKKRAGSLAGSKEQLRRAAREGRIIFVVSGPTGVGKTTVARRAVEVIPSLGLNVSCTTRPLRPGERSEIDYHFLSEAEFRALIESGELLEWAEVHGHLYGTRASDVLSIFKQGKDALLEIDIQGGKKVREHFERTVLIFLVAPSAEQMKARLLGRRSETEAQVRRRLDRAKEELLLSRDYEYVIVNDVVERAVRELLSIVCAERLRLTRQRYEMVVDQAKRL